MKGCMDVHGGRELVNIAVEKFRVPNSNSKNLSNQILIIKLLSEQCQVIIGIPQP